VLEIRKKKEIGSFETADIVTDPVGMKVAARKPARLVGRPINTCLV
jgi:hypothetical protein